MISLLTLLDDIATTFDDVAIMTKVAIRKTSALMTDDLAVNAGVINGVAADRELKIVKSIFIGSLINKIIVIIGLLTLLYFAPTFINYILILGGIYLSFEGAHKIYEKLFHKKEQRKSEIVVSENDRIKGAIKTDFVLSIEIMVLAQQALSGPINTQIISLIVIGLIVSVLIYGLVAILVKIDDLGIYLISRNKIRIGNLLVKSMPSVMRCLGVAGTIAMLLVGGGILNHAFHLNFIFNESIQNLIIGFCTGFVCVILFEFIKKLFIRDKTLSKSQ